MKKPLLPPYIRTHFNHLTHADKWLYVCLLDLCPGYRSHGYTLEKLEQETGVSRSAICRAIPRIQQSGLIHAEKKVRSHGDGREIWHITIENLTYEQAVILSQRYEKPIKGRNPVTQIEPLRVQVERAQDAGVSATLILPQWIETLDYYEWKCAYCPDGKYEVIEHFIPLTLGGGTTQANCVPACTSCNIRKKDYHPLLIPSSVGMGEAIRSVQNYLLSYRNEDL